MNALKKIGAWLSGAAAVTLSVGAQAAYTMPTAVTTGFADIKDAFDQTYALILPIVIAGTIGWFLVKMIKKGGSKVG